jgi:hypothetical protein
MHAIRAAEMAAQPLGSLPMDDITESKILGMLTVARRSLRIGDLRAAERTTRKAIHLHHEGLSSVSDQQNTTTINAGPSQEPDFAWKLSRTTG